MEQLSGITVTKLHNSTHEDSYLVISGNNMMEANRLTADLLKIIKSSDNVDAGIERFMHTHNNVKVTSQQLKDLLSQKILPMLMKEQKHKKQFLYQRQLLNTMQIEILSDKLSMLFNRYVMWGIMLAVTILDIYFFINTSDLLTFSNKISAFTIFAFIIFIIASSLFHELGHASACKHFGVRHGGIGFGLYINFPVLYTDVTNVWLLPRRKRIVVNIAGVYFQCMILALLLIGFFITGDDMLRYMILTMNFGFLLTLNPFFKFDGYWIATDMLGVPNLRKRSMELLKYLYCRMRNKPVTQRPYLLQKKKRERVFVVLYALSVNIFMGYYFLYIIPKFLYNFIGNFPMEVQQLVMCMANNVTPSFALLRNILSQVLFLALIVFMVYRMVYPMFMRKSSFRRQG